MKKIRTACTAALLLCGSPAAAQMPLPFDGSDVPSRGEWQVTSQTEVYRRGVIEYDDQHMTQPPLVNPNGSIEVYRMTVEGAVQLEGFLQVAGRLGFAGVEMDDFNHPSYRQEYGPGLGWGVGVRGLLLLWPSVGGRLSAFFDYDTADVGEWQRQRPTPRTFNATLEEWQIGLQADLARAAWNVYGGIRYSDATVDYEHPQQLPVPGTRRGGFEADRHVGLFGGAAYSFANGMRLGGSVNLLDAYGLHVTAGVRF